MGKQTDQSSVIDFLEDEYDPDEDIKDCPVPGCRYKQIFVSGTDYAKECWLVCKTCGDFVVDESKEAIND